MLVIIKNTLRGLSNFSLLDKTNKEMLKAIIISRNIMAFTKSNTEYSNKGVFFIIKYVNVTKGVLINHIITKAMSDQNSRNSILPGLLVLSVRPSLIIFSTFFINNPGLLMIFNNPLLIIWTCYKDKRFLSLYKTIKYYISEKI